MTIPEQKHNSNGSYALKPLKHNDIESQYAEKGCFDFGTLIVSLLIKRNCNIRLKTGGYPIHKGCRLPVSPTARERIQRGGTIENTLKARC